MKKRPSSPDAVESEEKRHKMGNCVHRFRGSDEVKQNGGTDGTSMMIGRGVRMSRTQHLLGFNGVDYPSVPMLADKAEPTIDGNIDDVAKKSPALMEALYNDVKVCTAKKANGDKCGKPCAFMMKACNQCGASLEDVAISKSENVFSAFLLGVKKSATPRAFPLTISMRRETPEVLIFDDMLALTPCHMNGISSKYYIPDWRFLINDPPKALKLLDTLEAELWEATKVFLQKTGFRQKVFKGRLTDDQIKDKIMKSFNYPPSQFQMHVQWLVPPMTPFQHLMAEKRNHFHEDRAFPLSYVRAVLKLNKPYKTEVVKDTPIQDIVDFYNEAGVSYKEYWTAFFEKCLQDSMQCANWDAEEFSYVVEDDKAYKFEVKNGEIVKGELVEGVELGALRDKDKAAMQNYGRPYNDGKTTGTYIKAPLQPKWGAGGYEAWPGVRTE